VSPLQFAFAGNPLVSLEIAFDAIGRLATFRGPVADDAIFPGRCVRDAGRAAETDRLPNSEFVVVHARPHASISKSTWRPLSAPTLAAGKSGQQLALDRRFRITDRGSGLRGARPSKQVTPVPDALRDATPNDREPLGWPLPGRRVVRCKTHARELPVTGSITPSAAPGPSTNIARKSTLAMGTWRTC